MGPVSLRYPNANSPRGALVRAKSTVSCSMSPRRFATSAVRLGVDLKPGTFTDTLQVPLLEETIVRVKGRGRGDLTLGQGRLVDVLRSHGRYAGVQTLSGEEPEEVPWSG